MADGFARGKGPVVLCFVDAEPTLPRSAQAPLEPLPEEAAYFAAGTGCDRLDVVQATRAFADRRMPLVDTALERLVEHARHHQGTVTDFYTEKEKPKCSLHLFVDIVKDGSSLKALAAVLDVLLPYDLHLGIHAFLAGPGRTAFFGFNAIQDQMGSKGSLHTVAGGVYSLGADAEWEKVLDAYRALVVLFEGETYERIDDALEENYAFQRDDVAMPPARIGEFAGINGDLRCEFPPPPDAGPIPLWEWRGDDLGMLVSTRGDQLDRLLRILTRTDLPEEVAKLVTLRGRPVIPFDAASLVTLVPMRGSKVPSLLTTAPPTEGLFAAMTAAKKRSLRVFDAAHAALATFSFDGDRNMGTIVDGEVDAAAALEKAARAVSEGALDFVLVAAKHAPLDELAQAVEARAGALLVVSPASISLVANGIAAGALSAGTFRDVFATVLDLVAVSDSSSGARSLVAR